MAALSKMRHVYEKASAVLVLDSWLMTCDSSRLSQSEILMRIFHSTWNRRLWTYQEGVLAKMLFFQFQNTTVEIDSFYQNYIEDRNIIIDLKLRTSLNINYRSRRMIKQKFAGRAQMLSYIILAVQFRATSIAEDEALCLATLLDLDMHKLLKYPPKSRMQVTWEMVGEVPCDILLHNSETIQKNGFRWAPMSLLVSTSNFNREGYYSPIGVQIGLPGIPLAQVTSSGLVFKQSGFVFNVAEGCLGTIFMLKDNKGSHHCLHVHFRHVEKFQRGTFGMNGGYQNIPITDPLIKTYGTKNIAFISLTTAIFGERSPTGGRVGILAALIRENSGVFYARKITTAMHETVEKSASLHDTKLLDILYPESEKIGQFQGIPLLEGKNLIVRAVVGMEKPTTQGWCVE
jgi:hypothetical protein